MEGAPSQNKRWSEEQRKARSEAMKGPRNPFYGRHHTEESRRKNREAHKGRHLPQETRQKLRNWAKRRWKQDLLWRKQLLEYGRLQWKNPNRRKEQTARLIEWWKDPSYRSRILPNLLTSDFFRTQWKDPEYRKKMTRILREQSLKGKWKGILRKPNKAEQKLAALVQTVCPNEYRYVGDGKVIIDGKCPDFINCNGQKKIIELFGDYWHKGQDPQKRMERFRQFGFNTLVVWEHELNQPDLLSKRIQQFSMPEAKTH